MLKVGFHGEGGGGMGKELTSSKRDANRGLTFHSALVRYQGSYLVPNLIRRKHRSFCPRILEQKDQILFPRAVHLRTPYRYSLDRFSFAAAAWLLLKEEASGTNQQWDPKTEDSGVCRHFTAGRAERCSDVPVPSGSCPPSSAQ